MGPIVLYVIITLWIAVMMLAVAAPFFTKRVASLAPKTPSMPFRQRSASAAELETPTDRTAA